MQKRIEIPTTEQQSAFDDFAASILSIHASAMWHACQQIIAIDLADNSELSAISCSQARKNVLCTLGKRENSGVKQAENIRMDAEPVDH